MSEKSSLNALETKQLMGAELTPREYEELMLLDPRVTKEEVVERLLDALEELRIMKSQ